MHGDGQVTGSKSNSTLTGNWSQKIHEVAISELPEDLSIVILVDTRNTEAVSCLHLSLSVVRERPINSSLLVFSGCEGGRGVGVKIHNICSPVPQSNQSI